MLTFNDAQRFTTCAVALCSNINPLLGYNMDTKLMNCLNVGCIDVSDRTLRRDVCRAHGCHVPWELIRCNLHVYIIGIDAMTSSLRVRYSFQLPHLDLDQPGKASSPEGWLAGPSGSFLA